VHLRYRVPSRQSVPGAGLVDFSPGNHVQDSKHGTAAAAEPAALMCVYVHE